MRRRSAVAILMLLCCCAASFAQEASVSTLRGLLECAGARSTETSTKVLTALRQRADIPLPEGLLAILQRPGMVRAQGGFAYGYDEGRHSVRWYLSDAAMRGKPEEVRAEIEGALPRDLHRRADGAFVSSPTRCGTVVELTDLSPFVGGKTATTGFHLQWTAYSMEKAVPLTLDSVLRVLPSLRDDRVAPEVYAALGSREVAELSIGGTWTRYYDWTVALRCRDAAAARSLGSELGSVLRGLGFTRSSDGDAHYRNPHGAHAWLEVERTLVRLRIQPES